MVVPRPKLIRSNRWREEPVFLLGGGPSAGDQVDKIRDRGLCIAINDSFRKCSWADAIFTIDDSWLTRRAIELSYWPHALIAALPIRMRPPEMAGAIEIVERREGANLSRDPGVCYYGENSGFGALNTAMANGAGRRYPIALVGFDMGTAGHWHDGYEWRCRFGASDYPRWVKYFATIARSALDIGIDIVNLNPDSAIKCFRFGSIEEFPGRESSVVAV